MATIAQVIEIIEEFAPRETALAGDPVGLQCGEPWRPAKRVMFALDACVATVDQALRAGADLLVTHHPLLFQPLVPGSVGGPAGVAFVNAVRGGLTVYSAHTNLDASPHGINASFADLLELRETKILQPTGPNGFKIVVFLPVSALESVKETAFMAGAGKIGNYSKCSFNVEGEGSFLGDETTSPVAGIPCRLETTRETRLELLVPEGRLEGVLDAVKRKHPYEEPVIDVFPLTGKPSGTGIGLVGLLPLKRSVRDVGSMLKAALRQKAVRIVGSGGRKVRKVAVCAGSGASLLGTVVTSGAELFISGDIKYHEARTAEEEKLSVLDIGHFGPERYGMLRFSEKIGGKIRERGWDMTILCAKEKDPFVTAL